MALTKERRAARELALDVLYQAEIRDQLPGEALASLRVQGWSVTLPDQGEAAGARPGDESVAYATKLVEGVQEHAPEIDALIAKSSERWAIERMPVVDKNVLRMAIFELLWMPGVPTAVVINEAVELAKSLSTHESGRFVNGILGRIAEQERRGEEARSDDGGSLPGPSGTPS